MRGSSSHLNAIRLSFMLLFIFSIPLKVLSQASPCVISSVGLNLRGDNTIWDIAIGETVILSIENGTGFISQGYLQPEIASPVTSVGVHPALQIRYYPNPFSDYLQIECNRTDVSFTVTDMTGRIIMNNNPHHWMDMSSLASGLYQLLTFDTDGHLLSVDTLCKSPQH